jgi:hypothetical protein
MAANILLNITPNEHNEYHDIESIVWVMAYCALRWLPHVEYTGVQLDDYITRLFDEHKKDFRGQSKGGLVKFEEMDSSVHLDGMEGLPPIFYDWFTGVKHLLADSIRKRNYDYSQIKKDDLRRCWQNAVEALEKPPLDGSPKAPLCDRVEHPLAKARNLATPLDATRTSITSTSLQEQGSRRSQPAEAKPQPKPKRKAAVINDGAEEEEAARRYHTRSASRGTSNGQGSAVHRSGNGSRGSRP